MKRQCRILVVDDEPDIEPSALQRTRRKMRSGPYGFDFAYNGVEALQAVNEH